MSKKVVSEVGASIKQKLLNFARKKGRPFNEVMQYYMIERFIYRLSQSRYKNRFILKGALMFIVWDLIETRATRDIDLLAKTANTKENITQIIQEICNIACVEDAVIFVPESVQCKPIQEQSEYNGIRACFDGKLDKARAKMQIDVGFGDAVFPAPAHVNYPAMLDMPTSAILGYTPETVIAEKVHAMVRYGLRNSRMKDYFDIWFLSNQFLFDGVCLSEAVCQTFLKREMKITDDARTVFDELLKDEAKKTQWKSFLDNNTLSIVPNTFHELIEHIKLFIAPVFEYSSQGKQFNLSWQCPGPWK